MQKNEEVLSCVKQQLFLFGAQQFNCLASSLIISTCKKKKTTVIPTKCWLTHESDGACALKKERLFALKKEKLFWQLAKQVN